MHPVIISWQLLWFLVGQSILRQGCFYSFWQQLTSDFRKNQEDYASAGGFDVNDDEIEDRRAKLAELAKQSSYLQHRRLNFIS